MTAADELEKYRPQTGELFATKTGSVRVQWSQLLDLGPDELREFQRALKAYGAAHPSLEWQMMSGDMYLVIMWRWV